MKERSRKTVRQNWLALGVTIFACSAMVGDVMNWLPLKGIGTASAMAPFPKVFCDNQGLEGFASEFTILASMPDGAVKEIPLTPEMYSRMKGPYNRRNVYGAALSFGPKLPPEMWGSVFAYGLGDPSKLPSEFGLPREATNFSVVIQTRTAGRDDRWTLSKP